MIGIMYRILIIVMSLGFFVNSCAYSLKYKSDIKMEIPITNKTEIRVNLPDATPGKIIRNSITQTIVTDPTQSIFVNRHPLRKWNWDIFVRSL